MSEPSLTWTVRTTTTDAVLFEISTANWLFAQSMWIEDQSTAFNEWVTWANASGTQAQKDAAAMYSGYAMETFINFNPTQTI